MIEVNLSLWGGSALTDQSIAIPQEGINPNIIPITYVPGRNTVFMNPLVNYFRNLHEIHSSQAAVALGKKGYKAVLQVKTRHGLFQKKFIEETQRSPW